MNLTNRLLLLIILSVAINAESMNEQESYNILKNGLEPFCETLHINNIIKSNIQDSNKIKNSKLDEIDIEIYQNIFHIKNNSLDQSYNTEHFRFFYTLEGNDAVANIDYVSNMGNIFEEVWSFYIDSMGFEPPPMNTENLYEINIEYLPINWFGYAIALGSGASCDGYIRMRNSYSNFNDNTEEENIQVTAAHEFFHAIQFGYNCYSIRLNSKDIWFMEATAVWGEDEMYNDINDLYRYMPNWFSQPQKSIDNQNGTFQYGTFILFQYIDEHLGGPKMIKDCWEQSKLLAHPAKDVAFEAIDMALEPYNSSFEDAYLKMRIANRIMSESDKAGIYKYNEAEGYRSVIDTLPEELIFFERGNIETIQNQSLPIYGSVYYSLQTESPTRVLIMNLDGVAHLSSVIKYQGKKEWTIRSGTELNIDPGLEIEWISLIVSSLASEQMNWDYRIQLSDGYSEDLTSFSPYPNPSFGRPVSLDMLIINGQTIYTTIFDLMGRKIWETTNTVTEPSTLNLSWNGLNLSGNKVSNGIYFILVEGDQYKKKHKIIYLKNNDNQIR